jgi:hypothetical protein
MTVVDHHSYSHSWIYKLEGKALWNAYHKQASVIMNRLNSKSEILEVGKGSGFLERFLESKGYHITTIDIDKNKKPDIISDIRYFCLNEKVHFDAVSCFEVLEHLEFKYFHTLLQLFKKISRKFIFLSLPLYNPNLGYLTIKFPFFHEITLTLPIPRKAYTKKISRYHKWEINYKSITMKMIRKQISQAGLIIDESEILKPYRLQFFTLLV